MKKKHDTRELKEKRMMLVWGDEWAINTDGGYDHIITLKASYKESAGGSFETTDITNLPGYYDYVRDVFTNRGCMCVKKHEKLERNELCTTLRAYGATSIPHFEIETPWFVDEPYHRNMDVL